ncbi:MAG: hypothetical protein ACXU98_10480, partial [Syntrophales bacterium]
MHQGLQKTGRILPGTGSQKVLMFSYFYPSRVTSLRHTIAYACHRHAKYVARTVRVVSEPALHVGCFHTADMNSSMQN